MANIPAIGEITDISKISLALVRNQQLVSVSAIGMLAAMGMPAGGTTGQVLSKASDDDYATEWSDIPAAGDFTGPASSVDGNFVAFNGTTGKLGKDSGKKAADFQAALGFTPREVITADRTYYVRTDGSDGNDGLSNTSAGALATVNAAIALIATIDLGGFQANISVQSGNFGTALIVFNKPQVGGAINLILASGAIVGGIRLTDINGRIDISGAGKIQPATNSICIDMNCPGYVTFSGIEFGASGTNNHIIVEHPGARLEANGSYSISGDAGTHVLAYYGGLFIAQGITVTLSGGTRAFSTFVNASYGAILRMTGITFVGAATGTRYAVTLNSVIQSGGGGASYFPGSTAGLTSSGGQYA